MIVIPAIDLMGGRAVRLVEGRREEATVYSERPWETAAAFAAAGATRVHVVDLDGAFAGARRQTALVRRLVEAAGVPVQVGGGLRDLESVAAVLDEAGAAFAIMGTAAVRTPELVESACRHWPGRIVVSIDARDGRVALDGWTETSTVEAADLAARAAACGAVRLLYTDISRDGTRRGPNVEATARLQRAVTIPVIASGGIGALDDLRALARASVAECVVGRALWDRVFTLREALEAVAC